MISDMRKQIDLRKTRANANKLMEFIEENQIDNVIVMCPTYNWKGWYKAKLETTGDFSGLVMGELIKVA